MTSDLELIVERINAGDYQNAERALRSLLTEDPRNADAWMLLAGLVQDPLQKEACYQRVLRIDPGNRRAARRLEALSGQPPALTELEYERFEALKAGEAQVSADAETSSDVSSPMSAQAERKEDGTPSLEQHLQAVRMRTGEQNQGFLSRLFPRRRKPKKKPGELSLAEMIELAGGGLPPGERRQCPNPRCGATVSKDAQKCPWCGEAL